MYFVPFHHLVLLFYLELVEVVHEVKPCHLETLLRQRYLHRFCLILRGKKKGDGDGDGDGVMLVFVRDVRFYGRVLPPLFLFRSTITKRFQLDIGGGLSIQHSHAA